MGRSESSALGARVELLEARAQRAAGPKGGTGSPYAWAVFPGTRDGVYTVRVTYPSGARQSARLVVSDVTHSVTLDESDATVS